jgi:methyl-accepting chemotaxis protein
MFKSLKTKILASMIILTFICTLTFMAVSFFTMRAAVTNQMESDGANLVTVINREIGKQNLGDKEKISTALKEIKEQSKDNIKYISLADTSLKIVASSDSDFKAVNEGNIDTVSSASVESGSSVTESIKEGESKGYTFKTETGDKVYNISTPFYEGDKLVGTISIGISLKLMNEMLAKNIIQALIIALLVQVLSIIVGVIISKNITTPITNAIDKLDYFAKGDFTVEFESKRNDETRKLADALNQAIFVLKGMLRETKQGMDELGRISGVLKVSSGNVESSSRTVSESIVEVAAGIEEQEGNVNQVNKALENFSAALEQIQAKVQNTTASSAEIESSADVGAEKLTDLVKSIEDVRDSFGVAVSNIQLLNEDANKINEIMNVINSVAEQTNLLALNAAIEAARAGEAGRGFSVVADEIRKLAEQVMDSSKSINQIVAGVLSSIQGVSKTTQNISGKMDKQINIVDNTMVAFKNIQSEVHKTTPQFKNIFDALQDVVAEEETIMNSVQEVSAISEQISASTQEISASVQEHVTTMEQLSSLADNIDDMTKRLNENIDRFKM